MKLTTTRFGEIEIDESRIVEMRGAILGFGHFRRYMLLLQDEKTPFCWFQSVDDGAVAFVVINPFITKPDYEPILLDEHLRLLEIETEQDILLLSIVTIRSQPFTVSANLRAPLVINIRKMVGAQVVLHDSAHSIQYPVETCDAGSATGVRDEEKMVNVARIGPAVAM
jgi:flagellar assembly factor FliW